MDINAHFVRKISATPYHMNSTHWIELSIHERDQVSKCVLFMHGADAAEKTDAYAAAINAVPADELIGETENQVAW